MFNDAGHNYGYLCHVEHTELWKWDKMNDWMKGIIVTDIGPGENEIKWMNEWKESL